MRRLYSTLLHGSLPLLMPYLLWRTRRYPNSRQRLKQWFGFGAQPVAAGGIWLHAASVGEVNASIELIRALQQFDLPITVTTQTMTGLERVKAVFANEVHHGLMPIDIPFAGRRFLANVQPSLAIFMETEIWPNTLALLEQQKIPVIIANGRLSERSVKAYKKWSALFTPALKRINHVIAQSEEDALRFLRCGVARQHLTMAGNLKFDISVAKAVIMHGRELRHRIGESRLVWIAASTHEWEEQSILECFKMLKRQHPDAFLVMVPRHPERFVAVAAKIKAAQLNLAHYSDNPKALGDCDVLLGDVMGKLMMFYAASDLAFVGGSLGQGSGHNPLEPAALGLPIITGSCYQSFGDIVEKMQKKAALVVVDDADELCQQLQAFAADATLRQRFAERAKTFVAENQGALNQHLYIIKRYCRSASNASAM